MRPWLSLVSEQAIVLIDAMALIVIVFATIEAFVKAVRLFFVSPAIDHGRDLWLRFARWLVAGLTFQLAADLIETSISTSWDSLARIVVVALVRTFLNYFLDRDLREIGARQSSPLNP